jgi:hypothetical protein
MSDAQSETRQLRQAVTIIDSNPFLELLAEEFVYPINTPDEQFTLYCHLRPYEPRAIKPWYDEVIARRKRRTAVETTVETPDYSHMREFVMNHFIGMQGAELEDGSAPSPEEQRAWLQENPIFVERIFRNGVDRFGPRETAKPGRAVLMLGQRQTRIPMEVRLVLSGAEFVIGLTATLDRLSESDRHQYDKSVSYIENSRFGETYIEANWDVIEILCNQRLKSLDGALVDGQPCVEANKAEWIKRVPFLAKVYVMARANQEIELKNAS